MKKLFIMLFISGSALASGVPYLTFYINAGPGSSSTNGEITNFSAFFQRDNYINPTAITMQSMGIEPQINLNGNGNIVGIFDNTKYTLTQFEPGSNYINHNININTSIPDNNTYNISLSYNGVNYNSSFDNFPYVYSVVSATCPKNTPGDTFTCNITTNKIQTLDSSITPIYTYMSYSNTSSMTCRGTLISSENGTDIVSFKSSCKTGTSSNIGLELISSRTLSTAPGSYLNIKGVYNFGSGVTPTYNNAQ